MKKFLVLLLAALLAVMPALAEEGSPLANDERTQTNITVSLPGMGDFTLAVSSQEGDYAHMIFELYAGDQLLGNLGAMMDAGASVLYAWSSLISDRPVAFDAEDMSMLMEQAQAFSAQMIESFLPTIEGELPELAALIRSGDFSSLLDPETGAPDLNAIAGLFGVKLDQIDPSALLGTLTTAFTMETKELDGVNETVITVTGENVAAVLTALADFVETNKDALGVFGKDELIASLRGTEVDANTNITATVGTTADGMPAYMNCVIVTPEVTETIASTFSFGEESVVTYRAAMKYPEQDEFPIMEYTMTLTDDGMTLDCSIGTPVTSETACHILLDGKTVSEDTIEFNANVQVFGDEIVTYIGKLTVTETEDGCNALLTVYPEGQEDQTVTVTIVSAEAEPVIAIVDGGEVDFPCKMGEEELGQWLSGVMERLSPILSMFGFGGEAEVEPAA